MNGTILNFQSGEWNLLKALAKTICINGWALGINIFNIILVTRALCGSS